MKKILAILLTFFSLFSALNSYLGLYSYGSAFLFPSSHQYVAETYFVSWLILITHLLQMTTFFALSYYGASAILNITRKYPSNAWLYIGVLSVILLFIEFIANAIPLRQIEGFTPSTFSKNFVEIISNPVVLKSQVIMLLTFATFFGLFSKFKTEAVK